MKKGSAGNILKAALTFLLAAAAVAAGAGAYRAVSAPAPEGEAKTWDDFTLPDASGRPVSLSQFIGKKPVLLFFWATWCPHCNQAVPAINRMHEEALAGGGVQILALDFMESPEKVNAFIASKKVAYPVLLDRNGQVARTYRVVGIPTYILIDRDGRTVYRDHELPEIARYVGTEPKR